MSGDVYVYYRVAEPASSAALDLVRQLIADVAGESAVRGRVLRRRDDAMTWMEVYEGIDDPDAFEAILERAVVARRAESILAPGSTRTIERFVAL